MTALRMVITLVVMLLGVAPQMVSTMASKRGKSAVSIPTPEQVAAAMPGGVSIIEGGERAILQTAIGHYEIDSLVHAPNTPEKKLAEAKFVFGEGPFAGCALDGFAIWYGVAKNGGGIQVYASGPERTYGMGKRYQMLRPATEHDEQAPETAVTIGRRAATKRDTTVVDNALSLVLNAAIALFGGVDNLRPTVVEKQATFGAGPAGAKAGAAGAAKANSVSV